MDLLIFNPEHDMALANNKCNFTIPKSVKEFRNSCDFCGQKSQTSCSLTIPTKQFQKSLALPTIIKKSNLLLLKTLALFLLIKSALGDGTKPFVLSFGI